MRHWFTHGALFVAVLGGVGLAAVEHPGRDAPSVWTSKNWFAAHGIRPIFADERETTGSVDRSAITQVLPLSEEQRALIFLGVMNLPDVPEATLDAPNPSMPLPSSVELQDLPAMVTRKVPLVANHKFVKLDDRILVVEPQSRTVVSQIPRYRLVLQ